MLSPLHRALHNLLAAILVVLLGLGYAHASTLADIQRYYSEQDLRELTIAGEPLPVLDIAPSLALARGVAIVLVSTESQSFGLNTAKVLGMQLKQKGWRTLVVPLDTASITASLSPTTAADKPITSVLNPPFDYDQLKLQVIAAINASYSYAQKYKGYTIVAAADHTAAVLLDAFAHNLLNPPDTLVAINPFWPDDKTNRTLIEWIGKSPYPLLDISWSTNNYWQQDTLSARKEATVVNFKHHYRQRIYANNQSPLPASTAAKSPETYWLASEIYAWVRYLGW